MDIGDYSRPTTPGFVKKYIRGVRRVLKKHQSKMNRQQGLRQIADGDQPAINPTREKTWHYTSCTRYTPYR